MPDAGKRCLRCRIHGQTRTFTTGSGFSSRSGAYNYVFWDIDPTDWDAVYDEYRPRFEALKDYGFVNKDINDSAARMMGELTKDLVDGHLSITVHISETDTTYYFSPNEDRVNPTRTE